MNFVITSRPVPEVIKPLSRSVQPSIQSIMLIYVKMPTIVGILTFNSRIDTTSERYRARNIVIFQHFNYCVQWKLHAQLS